MQSTSAALAEPAGDEGVRVLRGQVWLERVGVVVEQEELRSDSKVTVLLIAQALVVCAGRGPVAAPTWKQLATDVRRDRSTVARWLRWLREHQLLVLVEHTSVEEQHLMELSPNGGWPAVYLLTAPVGDVQSLVPLPWVRVSPGPTSRQRGEESARR